ncbi:Hypothetical protein PHPALM_15372, partial [Phytophthora palmivora]
MDGGQNVFILSQRQSIIESSLQYRGMLPALTTKPKQAVRQVKGLTNDSIDSYSNTPLGSGSTIGGGMATSYVDNTESGSTTARMSPPATSRVSINTSRTKLVTGDGGVTMARVVRDRKASGEEELSLRTGDIVKVLSSKRTGYLKCEAGDEVGYVPSSYLEFLDSSTEVENAGDEVGYVPSSYLEFLDSSTEVENGTSNSNGNATTEETQRAAEKQRSKHKKEKRKKEKREVNDASEPELAAPVAPVTARSPRKEGANAEDESNESPRRRKKKERKHRDREGGEDTHRSGNRQVPGLDMHLTTQNDLALKASTPRKNVITMEIAVVQVKVMEDERVVVATDAVVVIDVDQLIVIPSQHLQTIRVEATDEDVVGATTDIDEVL